MEAKQEYEALKKIGKKLMVHAYKFNGWLYRTWEYPTIIDNTDDYVVLANTDTNILTSEFNSRRIFSSTTKYPSFWVFFKQEWFNMVITVNNDKIKYYINLSSKFIYEESAIKYIDFELDFKILPNRKWVELDQDEYEEAKTKFNYPKALILKLSEIEKRITSLIENEYFIKTFDNKKLQEYMSLYNKYKKGE